MREYTETEELVKNKMLVGIKCDLCGKNAKTENWDSSSYEINETTIKITIKQKDGTTYPEGGWGTEYSVDMCPSCFKDKLIPWLESQGCEAKRQDWDW